MLIHLSLLCNGLLSSIHTIPIMQHKMVVYLLEKHFLLLKWPSLRRTYNAQ